MADIIEKAKAEGGSAIFESQSSKVANSNDEIVNSTNPFSFTSSPASLPQTTTISGFGFSSYANINPFEVVKNNSSSDEEAKSGSERGGGFSSFSASPKTVNPFSAVSTTPNPFASFGDAKTNVWTTASTTTPITSTLTDKPMFSGAFSFKRGLEAPSSSEDKKDTSKDDSSPPATKRRKAADDADEDNENDDDAAGPDFNPEEEVTTGVYGRIYQLPENVPVITGEEAEECTFTSRAKLYRLVRKATAPTKEGDSNESSAAASPREDASAAATFSSAAHADWAEVGIGPIKILKSVVTTTSSATADDSKPSSTKESDQPESSENTKAGDSNEPSASVPTTTETMKFRLVMRRESSRGGPGTKLLLNAPIKSYVTVAKVGDKMFRMTCICPKDDISTELVPMTFLFKTKTAEEADDLYEEIKSIVDHFNGISQ